MAFKMKYKNLKEVIAGLKKASKTHAKQAEIVEEHLDGLLDDNNDDNNSVNKRISFSDFSSPVKKKDTPCWKNYSHLDENGKPLFKKKGNKMVPDCRPI
jgi:hypothetical protein